ncbi:MAG: hypothetical protein JW712_00335 [Dehalococcoidales bacterium]|nr:hypothetical protein [Dehalococcoidales bacterium]
MSRNVYDILVEEFQRIVRENNLESEEITVTATTLTPEEAIGNPEDKDYPLITGKERLMQAEFRGHYGQAFTDMHGNFTGKLIDIAATMPENNFRRAIFISSLNAVMNYLGLISKTIHCKDTEPKLCSQELVSYMQNEYDNPKIAIVGFQPRIIEEMSKRYEVRVTDMDENNINSEKFGVLVRSPEFTEENLDWCDLAMVTGTTVVNNTIDQFMTDKPVIFYGVTISGTAQLLGLKQFCHCGH